METFEPLRQAVVEELRDGASPASSCALLLISIAIAIYFWRRRDEVEGAFCKPISRFRDRMIA